MKKYLAFLLALCMLFTLLSGCGKTYEVRFELNGGTKTEGNVLQSVAKGEAAVPPTVEREGYVFDGWDGDYTDVRSELVLTAEWTPLYKISFDLNGGELVSGETEQELAKGEMPATPETARDHWEFLGWDEEPAAAEGDKTYTAAWKELTYTSEEIYELISPCVVEITVFDYNGDAYALGSGFFVDDEGTIITNYHVMEGAYSAQILTSGSAKYDVTEVLGYDKDLDIAIIRTRDTGTPFIPKSGRDIRTGEAVYALGSSQGLTDTFTSGIVSTASREMDGVKYVQHDAAISHGNSGGPLVNAYGEVIGINTMYINDSQNLNFSIDMGEIDRIANTEPKDMETFYYDTGNSPSAATTTNTADASAHDPTEYFNVGLAESEPNDSMDTAGRLTNGRGMAAYVGPGEGDVFAVELPAGAAVTFIMMPFYDVDNDYLVCGVVDSRGDALPTNVDSNGGILHADTYNGEPVQSITFVAPTSGVYYLVVLLEANGYPYDEGPYYCVMVTW